MYAWMTEAGQAGFELLACCPETGVVLAGATTILLLGATLERGGPSVEVSRLIAAFPVVRLRADPGDLRSVP